MHQRIYDFFMNIPARYKLSGPALEIGISRGDKALLAGEAFSHIQERTGINLQETETAEGIDFIKANSNDLTAVFPDGRFNLVVSNAVIEHDKAFWKSLAEIKRILAPGGIVILAAPGFYNSNSLRKHIVGIESATGDTQATITFQHHAPPDYWRFSPEAFREVLCEGLEMLELGKVGKIPRVYAVARKLHGDDRDKTLPNPRIGWNSLEDLNDLDTRSQVFGKTDRKSSKTEPSLFDPLVKEDPVILDAQGEMPSPQSISPPPAQQIPAPAAPQPVSPAYMQPNSMAAPQFSVTETSPNRSDQLFKYIALGIISFLLIVLIIVLLIAFV